MCGLLLRGVIAAAYLVIASAELQSSIVTVPPDLKPGDKYRLIFVTSTIRDAAAADIADYDAFVTAVANGSELSSLRATWSVIGSTHSIKAADRIAAPSVVIYRLDGTRVANSSDDLWDGEILAPILLTEKATTLPAPAFVWTGTRTDGWISPFYLGAADLTSIGSPFATDYTWIDRNPTPSFAEHHLYGISSVLTVPGEEVPEPGSASIVLLGIIVFAHRVVTASLRSQRHSSSSV